MQPGELENWVAELILTKTQATLRSQIKVLLLFSVSLICGSLHFGEPNFY